MNIVSKKQVQGRYYNAGHLVILTENEIESVLVRVEEYISLTNDKSNKEYRKFVTQRANFEKSMDILMEKQFDEFLYPINIKSDMSFCYPCTELSYISNADIKDIISIKFNCSSVVICKQEKNMQISIKLDKENLLIFLQPYDIFKSQKGSVNS